MSAKDGYQLWSARYDRTMADIFAIQDEISQAIVSALRGHLKSADDVPSIKKGTKDLDAYRRELGQAVRATGGRLLAPPELGSESVGMTFREGRVRFFRITWRHANATALLFVNGFDERLELADVLALARKQQRRLEDASG